MPRTKGAKNKLRTIRIGRYTNGDKMVKKETPLPQEVIDRIQEAQETPLREDLPKIGKSQTLDRIYMLDIYEVFKKNIEPMVPEGFPDDAHGNYRFTPMQIWRGMDAYIRVTLRQGQPLTMSGMAVFAGIRVTTLSMIRNNPRLHPAYHFIRYMSDFIEMYNELAAHKRQNPAGPIFILKNMGWKDKFEVEASANPGALSEEERAAAQKRIQEFSEKV